MWILTVSYHFEGNNITPTDQKHGPRVARAKERHNIALELIGRAWSKKPPNIRPNVENKAPFMERSAGRAHVSKWRSFRKLDYGCSKEKSAKCGEAQGHVEKNLMREGTSRHGAGSPD
ncbi:hypothetical protein HAX54_038857 [Datura stramonium]|uniref:Uncharacterized protein n=1 Tax=Datura stramonium TaxID=4076 RepID=A0ABS8VL44_DATST|nr:hypothetical protein [Datura stramonium]